MLLHCCVDVCEKGGIEPPEIARFNQQRTTLRVFDNLVANRDSNLGNTLIDGNWRGQRGLETARAVVDAFVKHWDAHRAVLLVRNLAADEGERAFQRVRRAALTPVLESLARKVQESQQGGRIPPEVHPHAAAAAMAAILERLAAYHREIEPLGVTRPHLVETCARILYQTVTGRTASG